MIRTHPLEQTRPLLGPCLAVYKAPRLHLRQTALLLGLVCLVVLVPLGLALYQAYTGYTRYGPVAAAAWSKPWLTLGLAGLALCLLLSARGVRLSRRSLAVHAHGLRLRGFSILWHREIFWSQLSGLSVEYLQTGGTLRTRLTLFPDHGLPIRVSGRAGEPLHLGELPELSSLVIRLKEYLYPRLQPVLLRSLADGTTLTFGPLALNRETFRPGRLTHPIPWDKVCLIEVRKGYLVVEYLAEGTAPHRTSIPCSKIPNLELFLHTVELGEILSAPERSREKAVI